jgi:AGCS family alanine or glycine:cation symporter
LKRIATVANVFVPLMCGLYIIAATVIILSNIAKLPDVVALVVRHAFTPAAATGGFAGSSVLMAIRYGFARGVFSNEAGMGSAPIAHATAMTDHPARQGLWGIFEVFVDTLVICALTGFSILLSGVWSDGSTGATLTMHAFATTYGHHLGFALVAISMVLTAYDTLLAWGFYGETCAAYVFGHGLKVRQVYRLLWLPATLLGALGTLEVIWSIADTLNGLMALPNLIALLVLGSVAARLARGFFAGRPYDPALGARR